MAVRAVKKVVREDKMVVWTWAALNEVGSVKDTGAPVVVGNVEGLIAQGTGNFDTAAVVKMQGSNDGVTYFTISTNDLTASVGATTVLPRPLFVRPAVTTDGSADATAVVVTMVGAQPR